LTFLTKHGGAMILCFSGCASMGEESRESNPREKQITGVSFSCMMLLHLKIFDC
jgi:hypothetical protein